MKGEKIFFGMVLFFMELNMQEKLRLINFFEFLLNEEISKPLGEMNPEAVDNYIKILLHLQDKHIELSSEFIDEQVRKIFHPKEVAAPETAKTTKKYFNKKKIWLVAACIAILVALFSIVSFSSERSVVDVLEDFIGTFEFIPYGKETDIGNETYGKGGRANIYSSIEDCVKTEKTDLLCPSDNIAVINHISIGNTDKKKTIDVTFEKSELSITITLDSDIPQETIDFCNDKITLNETDYHICLMEDINQIQAYFVHNNNMYRIIHTDKTLLMEILNNMEEIKYEA